MKSFINLEDGSDLTDLSPVLTCIRTLNESDILWDEDRSKYFKSLSLKQLKCETDNKELDGFCFVVSLRDGSCLYTSSSITKYLGYPRDMLIGQFMMNFLFQKDHITFANHLTQGLNACFIQGKRDDSHLVLNTFFCRLRVYQGLRFGYVLTDKKIQYKPFKITFHINELIFDDLCVEKPSGTLCVKASATHVESAYTTPEEIPAMSSFSTRHTASCHFSHVDGSAIPYLGYLPQDMIGYSVFDFYHIDDLLQLKDIYELVIKEHGSSFRSKPYRFKIQNGSYIMLETEWSCFINPWTHKLEFVVGQHRVLKGPTDIDIFSPNEIIETETLSEEILNESQNIQKEIKSILSQSLPEFENRKNKRFSNKRKRDLASFVYSCIDGTLKDKDNKKTGCRGDEANDEQHDDNSDPDSVVMGDMSPYREVNDTSVSSETAPTMQQLRFKENIERFFASKPKTYSDESDESNKNEKLSASIDDSPISSSGSGNDSASVNASGSAPQDQPHTSKTFEKVQESSSNSSKYNLSRDSGYGQSYETVKKCEPGTSQAGSYHQTWTKRSKDIISNRPETFSSCLALTEESLSVHNRIGHKHLKQLQRKKSGTMPVKDNWFQQKDLGHIKQKKGAVVHGSSKPSVHQVDLIRRKSSHDVETTQFQPFSSHVMPVDSHAATSSVAANTSQSPCIHTHGNCCAAPVSPSPFFVPVFYMGSMPYYPTPQPWTYPTPVVQEASSGAVFPGAAPFYPHNVFMPNQMDSIGFPHSLHPNLPVSSAATGIHTAVPSSGLTSTMTLTTTATTIASMTAPIVKNVINGPTTTAPERRILMSVSKPEGYMQKSSFLVSDMQVDESMGSTFSSSFQSVDKEEDMEIAPKICCPSPAEKIQLSSDVAFRYQMGAPNVSDVLKKDRQALQEMHQPEMVNQQLQMLHQEARDEGVACKEEGISEEVMLGLTTEDEVNEELECQERWLLQFMCEDS